MNANGNGNECMNHFILVHDVPHTHNNLCSISKQKKNIGSTASYICFKLN